MAKQIYDFEVFADKKEQLRRIQRKRMRAQWAKRVFISAIVILIIIVLYVLQNSRCDYYIYKEETTTENNNDVSYISFAGGYVKYSGNGVEYQKKFGVAKWNVPVSYQEPFMECSKEYFLLADKGSNQLTIFDSKGKIRDMTLKYPIMQADISDQGVVEVILEGEESSFIQIYNEEANLIAEMRSSVDETGYPVAAAISPNGAQLAVSYFAIEGMGSKTTVAIYDFSQQLQNGDITLKGGFTYEDFMIPKLSFTGKNTVAAFGEKATYYYNVLNEPEMVKEVRFEQNIQSVFEGEKYTGYILDNSDNTDGDPYRLCLYDKSGRKKIETTVDMNYDTLQIEKNEIYAIRGNECTIMNQKGRVLFQEKLDGSTIETIIPARGWRTYYVIFRDKFVKMSLRFWGD